MSFVIPQINTSSDAFQVYAVRLNEVMAELANWVITTDDTANGQITTGNAYVNGYFSASVISTNTLRGGNNQTPANLNITSNVVIGNNAIILYTNGEIVANGLVIGDVTISNGVIEVGNVYIYANGEILAGNVIFDNVTANNIIANDILVGNVEITNNNIRIGNTYITGNLMSGLITVAANDAVIGTESEINFIAGNNVTLNISDNPANGQVNVVISSSGIGAVGILSNNTPIGLEPYINFIAGNNVTLAITDDAANNQVNVVISASGGGGGNSTPAGANTQVQYNTNGAFDASAGLTFTKASNTLFVSNAVWTGNSTVNSVVKPGYALLSHGNTNIAIDSSNSNIKITGPSNTNALLDYSQLQFTGNTDTTTLSGALLQFSGNTANVVLNNNEFLMQYTNAAFSVYVGSFTGNCISMDLQAGNTVTLTLTAANTQISLISGAANLNISPLTGLNFSANAAHMNLSSIGLTGVTIDAINGISFTSGDNFGYFGPSGLTTYSNTTDSILDVTSTNFAGGILAGGLYATQAVISGNAALVLTYAYANGYAGITINGAQVLTAPAVANLGIVSSGTLTLGSVLGADNLQYVTGNGAFTLAFGTADGSIDLLLTNGSAAGTITFSGFSGSAHGDSLDTTNNHKFWLMLRKINGVSMYRVQSLQ